MDGDQYLVVVDVPVLKLALVVNCSRGKMLHCAFIVDGSINADAINRQILKKVFFMINTWYFRL